MRSVVVAGLVVGLAGAGVASSSGGPSLALAGRAPIVLDGRLFHSGEAVQVTVVARVRRVRTVRADAHGRFVVRFSSLSIPHCGGAFARARGAGGSVAVLKIPLPACQPA